eukprot:14947642-Alexandrium_andersonii.AAC.1
MCIRDRSVQKGALERGGLAVDDAGLKPRRSEQRRYPLTPRGWRRGAGCASGSEMLKQKRLG